LTSFAKGRATPPWIVLSKGKEHNPPMWKSEWDTLSARITAIVEAATFLVQSVESGTKSQPFTTNTLIKNCEQTARSVQLLSRYGNVLPLPAREALERFQTSWRDSRLDPSFGADPQLQGYVVALASIRSELDHLLADHNEIIRSHVKRAFMHLQRSLIVDQGLRDRWIDAFDEGETHCERLGGVHLLLHGIWAFKADAAGAVTDLVLGESLVVDQDLIAASHGLVLTEWKRVTENLNPEEAKRTAKNQASQYAEGSLGGYDLRAERYLVLVGKKEFKPPKDEIDGGVTYKIIPIFLERDTPSASARLRND
jgi:hypothetical protein